MEKMALQPQTTLQSGKYKIIQVLGQGGFGITYLAEQVMLGRKVAVKEFFMKDLCNRDEDTCHVSVGSTGSVEMVARFKEKFLKEARLIAGMDNNHIVRIYDIFEENGTAYYIMEYIDGGSVDGLVKDGALEESRALAIIREVADALQYIHQQNVLHLDVKPSNLLFRKNGEVVLIDFGISKRYDVEGGQTSTTPVGISKGFAPIEQYNQGLQNFSPATDVYSLGATFYKLLTGQTPPEAPVLLDDEDFPECPSNVSNDMWSVIEKAMEPRRKKRYQSVEDFMKALKRNGHEYNEAGYVSSPKANENFIATNKGDNKILSENFGHTDSSDEDTIISLSDEEQNRIILFGEHGTMYQPSNQPIDLGLSVYWYNTNVGATDPSEAGDYVSYDDPMISTYITNVQGSTRVPTSEEWDELVYKCQWTWIEEYNCSGYMVKGPSGRCIFLPAGGKMVQSGSENFFWTYRGLESVHGDVIERDNEGCYWANDKSSYVSGFVNRIFKFFSPPKMGTKGMTYESGNMAYPIRLVTKTGY